MRKILDILKMILLALIISFGVRVAFVEAYWVPTGSMKPTILEGDRILGEKVSYRLSRPKAGDIIVFTPPAAAGTQAPRLVKRVVGVENDLIEVKGGAVHRNGIRLNEPYILDSPGYVMRPVRVPEGHLFVLGDNRQNSLDSHVWGFVPEKAVIARGVLCYWPLSRIGLF